MSKGIVDFFIDYIGLIILLAYLIYLVGSVMLYYGDVCAMYKYSPLKDAPAYCLEKWLKGE